MVGERWSVEQVAAVAPGPSAFAAAEPLADPRTWSAAGADDQAVWGRCQGSAGEPYDVAVDHVQVAFRCSCPSRRRPCKHALGLLLRWARAGLPEIARPEHVARWIDRHAARPADPPRSAATERPAEHGPGDDAPGARGPDDSDGTGDTDSTGGPTDPDDRSGAPAETRDHDRARDERMERARAGLIELDRWLEDRVRTGLSDPSMSRFSTWDDLAARLVDARAGSLANRIRRLAGVVGTRPDWHDRVLAELGVLHLLANAGLRVAELPDDLADAVAAATGWQVRQSDVVSGVPDTDDWIVAGRSDTREDRIEVRRVWLRGLRSGRWAMVLSFAAYRQSLDESLVVGSMVTGDLHRYPGGAVGSIRAVVGERLATAPGPVEPPTTDVAGACDELGRILAREPWSERVPTTVTAAPAPTGDRWVLTDQTGSLPLAPETVGSDRFAILLAATGGEPTPVTIEWTADGAVPLTVHRAGRAIDVGPTADPRFVAAR